MSSPSSYIIEKLGREHDLKSFDCGTPSLTGWLHKFAWQNQQADSAKVYVAVIGNRVAGYYALTAGSVIKEESPARIAKGLANHSIGVILLARRWTTGWLHKFAWQNQQADSAKVYVAVAGNRVAGYYTLTAGSVIKEESPARIAKGLANHPIGVILLARLAVDIGEKGKGLGQALLSMH
ncbi:MAG TPA: hypothetical protein VNV86_16610 [Candidatus Acidoferrum sp.]|nr:hypothetical protein [Candidatus Acidoferrum sp.]